MLTLEVIKPTQISVEVEGILPAIVREMSAAEVSKLPVQHGNQQAELGEFFRVTGTAVDEKICWAGELSTVQRIGEKMESGTIIIEGNAGRHVGNQMCGGSIRVTGSVSDWLGAEMHGGTIRVQGSAGDHVGGAYPGNLRGMTGGSIVVDGSAGDQVGHSQRRGIIAIGGDIGDYAAINLLAGTLLIGGRCGKRLGAGMRRGTIVCCGAAPILLPTFRYGCRYQPNFLKVVLRQLQQQQVKFADALEQGPLDLYHGDLLHGGRGEVLVRAN